MKNQKPKPLLSKSEFEQKIAEAFIAGYKEQLSKRIKRGIEIARQRKHENTNN